MEYIGKYMAVLFNEYREKSVQCYTANEEHLFPRTSMMLEDMKKPKGERSMLDRLSRIQSKISEIQFHPLNSKWSAVGEVLENTTV